MAGHVAWIDEIDDVLEPKGSHTSGAQANSCSATSLTELLSGK